MQISDRIIKIRGDLERQVFASKIGVSARTVQRWELEDALPKGEELKKIAEIFSVNVHWLVTGEGDQYINKDREQIGSAQDPEGLWGDTAQVDIEGDRFSVTAFAPKSGREGTAGTLGQAVDMLSTVLNSGDSIYVHALMSNLVAFSDAVQARQKQDRMQDRIKSLENECDKLKEKLEDLEKRLMKRAANGME